MSARRRLSHLLLASHIGLVLLLAVLLLATGAGSIRSAVLAQARTQAEQAVSEARRRLQEWRRELNVGANLLSEQPTLQFYLGRGQVTKARLLVEDFHRTSGIEYIRVRLGDRVIAEYGERPPGYSGGFVFAADNSAWRVVQTLIPALTTAEVVVAERLGKRLEPRPAADFVSIELRPVLDAEPGRAELDSGEPLLRALRLVSASGDPETLEEVGDSAAIRIVSVRDDTARSGALLVARVSQDWVEERALERLAAFALTSLGTAGLALALAVLLAARISRPFAEVARVAERLGGGDLETPVDIPDSILVEPVALSASLEEMRTQVRALTASERSQRLELNAVLDGVDEGIVGVDAQGRIHYANRQFLALTEQTREQVLGQLCEQVLHELEPVAAPALGVGRVLQRCVAVGHTRSLILRRLAASGDRKVLIVREETAFEAARAMRDRILANLSHEFQTPLSAQMASIELLRDHLQHSTDLVAVRLTDAQYRGALRLSQLVENLLDSVRIESGEMRLRRQSVDLSAVIAEAVELMQPLTDQRDQRVLLNLPAGVPLVGDTQRLFSVIVNLLANANKFAPDQTTIWVDLLWQPEQVTVWVEDEGPGLPPLRSTSDLFAPFRRAPHEEPSQRGSGLGLAIVQAVVLAHGGEVVVAPPAQRHGARIGIVLPIEAAACAS